nr:MAG TPA: hypothetical protein [Caudoviricetes sp.]
MSSLKNALSLGIKRRDVSIDNIISQKITYYNRKSQNKREKSYLISIDCVRMIGEWNELH